MNGMTEDSIKYKHKYFCNRCKDKNYLIKCRCGYCNEIRFLRDKNNTLRYYMPYHHNKKENHHNWKGGRMIDKNGYVLLLMPDYPNCNSLGYIREHIYFYEQYYKCCMLPWGEVHHIEPVTKDYCNNMPWNIIGMTRKQHRRLEMILRNKNKRMSISLH